MIYVMSDIHGCYQEYLEALDLISFSDDDILFVLGDVVDRGKEPISVLLDMMNRYNVYPILGNHDFAAKLVLSKLGVEITDESIERLEKEDIASYFAWLNDGASTTIEQYRKLSKDNREAILEYLDEFALYGEIEVNGKDYVMVHAGFEPYDLNKKLDDYSLEECIFTSPDWDSKYDENKIFIMGHTPVMAYGEKKIIKKHNRIYIDGGCVFGGCLAIYCLDNGKEYYVQSKRFKD